MAVKKLATRPLLLRTTRARRPGLTSPSPRRAGACSGGSAATGWIRGSEPSALERVGNLHEQQAVRPLQVAEAVLQPVVGIPHEEHGLPVDLVGEEGRARERAAAGAH